MSVPGSSLGHAAPRVAVLEDDPLLRNGILLPGLARFGFDAAGFETVALLRAHLLTQHTDLVLLDLGLPDGDGFEVARTLRESTPTLGIVMLTSRGGVDDRVRGLSEGADAYLSKPVELDLLAATLHSLLRRTMHLAASVRGDEKNGWRPSFDGWCLISPSGTSISLTETERRLCERLFAQEGMLVSRDALVEAVADDVDDFDPHRIDSIIHRLRAKARKRCGEDLPLDAVHGRGYIISPK